jgi:hypothetical protein
MEFIESPVVVLLSFVPLVPRYTSIRKLILRGIGLDCDTLAIFINIFKCPTIQHSLLVLEISSFIKGNGYAYSEPQGHNSVKKWLQEHGRHDLYNDMLDPLVVDFVTTLGHCKNLEEFYSIGNQYIGDGLRGLRKSLGKLGKLRVLALTHGGDNNTKEVLNMFHILSQLPYLEILTYSCYSVRSLSDRGASLKEITEYFSAHIQEEAFFKSLFKLNISPFFVHDEQFYSHFIAKMTEARPYIALCHNLKAMKLEY